MAWGVGRTRLVPSWTSRRMVRSVWISKQAWPCHLMVAMVVNLRLELKVYLYPATGDKVFLGCSCVA